MAIDTAIAWRQRNRYGRRVTSSADAVIAFLTSEQARGVTHVYLDDGARDSLRELSRRSQAANTTHVTYRTPSAAKQTSAHATSPAALAILVGGAEGSKAERLESLRQQAATWQPARALGTLRETMVFATGNPDARIMLVGEAPGNEEEKKGQPFAGPIGEKLDAILKAMGLSREEIYITNIVKFRPAMPRQATNNRKPNPQEIAACLPFIHAEISIVQPACIIALGGTAAEGLLGLAGAVPAMRGSWHQFAGIPVRVTEHPSCLLRSDPNYTIRRQMWEDMLTVMEQTNLPISAKQRGFFLPKG